MMQQALKLCNSTLSKFPGNHLIRVLKAVALQRTGRENDAVQVGEVYPTITGIAGRGLGYV